MAKTGQLGCEAAVGSLTPAKKKEYKVSNRLHEGKRPLYAISFNFIDARYYDVFATVGGNRVCHSKHQPPTPPLLSLARSSKWALSFVLFFFFLSFNGSIRLFLEILSAEPCGC